MTPASERHRKWLNKPGNKERVRTYSRARYRNDPKVRAQLRRARLLRLYGITPEQYDVLFERHGGACAIGGGQPHLHTRGRPRAAGKLLHVDHDHATNLVRGLLCDRCNQAIGLMRDEPALLEAAAAYLKLGAEAN